jgi:hypothetical protein
MSRTEVTSHAIRQTHGSVVHVDFTRGRIDGASNLPELAHLVMTRAGVPIALGVAWLIVMFATIAFANEGERSGETAGVAAVHADDTSLGTVSHFDFADVPSVDSINAHTDIKPFLRSGVPLELHRAGLRRAWRVDPAIRDFRALQENDWDFNDPNSIPGFCAFTLIAEQCQQRFSTTHRASSVTR